MNAKEYDNIAKYMSMDASADPMVCSWKSGQNIAKEGRECFEYSYRRLRTD